MLRIFEINRAEELIPYKEEWNKLIDWSNPSAIELSYEWIISTWQFLCGGSELLILLVKDNGNLIGIAPLMIINNGIKTIKFIAADNSNYADFIVRGNRQTFLELTYGYLMDNNEKWDKISLNYIPGYSSTLTFFKNLISDGIILKPSSMCPHIEIDRPWHEYIRHRGVRHNLRHHINCLKRLGKLSFKHCVKDSEIEKYLKLLIQYHRIRWGKTDTPSRFEKINERKFIEYITYSFWMRRMLDLSVLKIDDHPIAIEYSLVLNKTYLRYLTTFDDIYSRFSPGKVNLFYFIKDAFEKGFSEVDLGRGATAYKFFWTDKKVELYEINICNKTSDKENATYIRDIVYQIA